MKLLFDANLSPKLVGRLAELFPESVHVFETGLARHTSGETIWDFARATGFAIVTARPTPISLPWLMNAEGRPKSCGWRTATTRPHRWKNSFGEMQFASPS